MVRLAALAGRDDSQDAVKVEKFPVQKEV